MNVPVYIIVNCYYMQNDKFLGLNTPTAFSLYIRILRTPLMSFVPFIRKRFRTQTITMYRSMKKQRFRMYFIAGRMQKTNSTNVS